jgi:sugar-specific transcriptional regulator TrmB
MNFTALKEAGLTEGEIKVYLALLEIGSATSGKIVEKSGVARSIIYQLLEKLAQKGLVSHITKSKTKHYEAAPPQKILEYIEHRREEFEQNKAEVEALLPELLLKQQLSEQNEANFYQGYKGINTAHEKLYKKAKRGEEYWYLGIPAFQPAHMHLYWQRDHERRVKAGITCRILFNADTDPAVVKQRNSYWGCDARLMPKGPVSPAMLAGCKDMVLITVQHPTPISVEIVNKEVADSFKSYFEHFWRMSKPRS